MVPVNQYGGKHSNKERFQKINIVKGGDFYIAQCPELYNNLFPALSYLFSGIV
jgi:hypothetical protein